MKATLKIMPEMGLVVIIINLVIFTMVNGRMIEELEEAV